MERCFVKHMGYFNFTFTNVFEAIARLNNIRPGCKENNKTGDII
jgi:hypothetical protein